MLVKWSQLRNFLIEEAEIPTESQVTVTVSEGVEKCIICASAYGDDMYCLLLNSRPFDIWECNPVLKFVHATSTRTYPVTELPATLHVFGIEANNDRNTVAMGHFSSLDSEGAIYIDIFSVKLNFKVTRIQSISTETAFCRVLGTFASPVENKYVALWGDHLHNDINNTFVVKKDFDHPERINTSFLSTTLQDSTLWFQDISELYPGDNNSVYASHVYGVGNKHLDCLAVIVYHAISCDSDRAEPVIKFHTVVKLPFHLHFSAEDILKENSVRYTAVITRMLRKADYLHVCLVRISVPVVSDGSATSISGIQSTPSTTTVEKRVYLLLCMSTHTVLDLFVPVKYEKCTIDATGQHIVRFCTKNVVTA